MPECKERYEHHEDYTKLCLEVGKTTVELKGVIKDLNGLFDIVRKAHSELRKTNNEFRDIIISNREQIKMLKWLFGTLTVGLIFVIIHQVGYV